jgi:WD40 repeat protein
VQLLRYSPDGKQLAISTQGRPLNLHDAATGKRLVTLDTDQADPREVSWSPDGKHLLAVSRSRTILVWDTATGKLLRELGCHVQAVAVAFDPRGDSFATVGFDRDSAGHAVSTVKIWDAKTFGRRAVLAGPKDFSSVTAYSPDGRRLAAGGRGKVVVWEVASRSRSLAVAWATTNEPDCLTFTPDSRRLAFAARGELLVWDLTARRVKVVSEGYRPAHVGAFSSDAKRLVSATRHSDWGNRGGQFLEVCLWDTMAAEATLLLETWERRRGPYAVTLSPDGSRLVTGHADGAVRVWSVKQLLSATTPSWEPFEVRWGDPRWRRYAALGGPRTAFPEWGNPRLEKQAIPS